MDEDMESSFSSVTMEVWSSSASEEEEEVKSTSSLLEEIVVEEMKCHNSNNNNNNSNSNDSLCREVTQGEIKQCGVRQRINTRHASDSDQRLHGYVWRESWEKFDRMYWSKIWPASQICCLLCFAVLCIVRGLGYLRALILYSVLHVLQGAVMSLKVYPHKQPVNKTLLLPLLLLDSVNWTWKSVEMWKV